MNPTVSTAPGLHSHPPQPVESPAARDVRRVGLLDRTALHLGVALITWSRRSHRPRLDSRSTHERRANQLEQQLAALARERAGERLLKLTAPPRP